MLVFLVMLQYAVKAHAHRVAEAAAEEALAAASAYDGTAASGKQAGNHMLSDLGSLSNTTVVVTRSGDDGLGDSDRRCRTVGPVPARACDRPH